MLLYTKIVLYLSHIPIFGFTLHHYCSFSISCIIRPLPSPFYPAPLPPSTLPSNPLDHSLYLLFPAPTNSLRCVHSFLQLPLPAPYFFYHLAFSAIFLLALNPLKFFYIHQPPSSFPLPPYTAHICSHISSSAWHSLHFFPSPVIQYLPSLTSFLTIYLARLLTLFAFHFPFRYLGILSFFINLYHLLHFEFKIFCHLSFF